eukprot:92256-Pyramimonas_sp.AAC.1
MALRPMIAATLQTRAIPGWAGAVTASRAWSSTSLTVTSAPSSGRPEASRCCRWPVRLLLACRALLFLIHW